MKIRNYFLIGSLVAGIALGYVCGTKVINYAAQEYENDSSQLWAYIIKDQPKQTKLTCSAMGGAVGAGLELLISGLFFRRKEEKKDEKKK